MADLSHISDPLFEALGTIDTFITETTGREPTQQEIADALQRYFVLNEIKAHILMARGAQASESEPKA